MSDCLNCVTLLRSTKRSSGKIRANLNVRFNASTSIKGTGSIRPANSTYIVVDKTRISGEMKVRSFENVILNPKKFVNYDNSSIKAFANIDGNIRGKLASRSKFHNTFADKIGGPLTDRQNYLSFTAKEKLYPIKDLITSYNNSYLVNENLSTGNLHESISDGVISNQYINSTFIMPSSVYTEGTFKYKCQLNNVFIRPEQSYLLIRAVAPMYTYSANLAPLYKLSNIKFEDPSGNLIVKYKDVEIRGDDYYGDTIVNYATYITEPEINYGRLHTWEENYPLLGSGNTEVYNNINASGYTLSMDFDIECLDDPFDQGFNFGYQERGCELQSLEPGSDDYLALDGSPISTQTQGYSLNPNNAIRISEVEIANSGQAATLTSNVLNFYTGVSSSGLRLERKILPSQVLSYDFDTGIYPDVDTLWESYPESQYNNSEDGIQKLTQYIRHHSKNYYITSKDPGSNGKLKLKFSHEAPKLQNKLFDGEFNIGFLNKDKDVTRASLQYLREADSFFTIDSISLKVVAKKAVGEDDYVLDIVGYSDDKLLHVTSAVGGFLQNVEGVGDTPAPSGFGVIDDLGISSESLSEKDNYFETSGTNNAGGDHYKLSTSPIISSTEFAEYNIPLRIYEDNVTLGQSTDYSMSSYFENLYVDIYPIPSGASIASAQLIVTYKPSNGIMLHTVGHGLKEFENRNVNLLPSSGIGKDIISTYADQISLIENIPHGFSASGGINGESTLKTNYSRRWRGTSGETTVSAFSNSEFDYSFDKDFIQYPFVNYYDFNNVTSSSILPFNISDKVSTSELLVSGNLNIVSNIGSRFKSSSLFTQPTSYTTIDWTSITGYENDALYGKIGDTFDSAIRISGVNSYLYTNQVGSLDSGFAAFIRFSPDIDISGAGYNLFNSGVIFGQFDSDLSFALGFEDGYLTVSAKDNSNNIVKIQDSATYDSYNYPIAVAITYNEQNDNKLRLYTDSDISGNIIWEVLQNNATFVHLRGTSDSFEINDQSEPLTVGYSRGSGIGMNMFLTDFGISYFDTDESIIGKITEDDFLNLFDDVRMPFMGKNFRYRLWQRIDNNTNLWHLGAYKICEFNQDFDRFTNREGSDYVFHYLKHDGLPYQNVIDIDFPNNVSSGVAYHTQIENDMLRFGIGAESGTFNEVLYSPKPRINKNIPRGYNFAEDALVVDTILEHDTNDNILWEDGNIGPRFIVSLYTTNKDPSTYEANNYGLINRQIHYLEPSGCWRKITTQFDANSFFDETTEPWSNFPSEKRLTEFNHKYFSKDIENMFVQYDLVYPSGSAFESTIKIHSVNVGLKDALVQSREMNDSMNLHVSGQKIWREYVNLVMPNTYDVVASGLDLYVSGVKYEASGNMDLYVSGAMVESDSLILHSLTIGRVDNIGNNDSLFGSYDPSYGMSLYVSGQYFDDQSLPLYLENKIEDQSASGILSLVAFSRLPKYSINDSIVFHTYGTSVFKDFVPDEYMNLFVAVDTVPESTYQNVNLYVNSYNPNIFDTNDSLPLFVVNYRPIEKEANQSEYVDWTSTNVGTDIELDDNVYAFLDADDEIRGVNITCYGDCNNGGTCEETRIVTHETVWGDSDCVNGGIFRASNVYTNLEASGFKTDVGYSGHFYGIRKYVGLIPDAPYKLVVTGRTADGSVINVPREMDTIEYGSNDVVDYSGTKLIADDPYSLNGRQEGDQYGKSIAIKGDLMAVGAPYHTFDDTESYELEKAGTVFVYRRDPQPTGYEWDYDKAGWNLEAKLSLPSGMLRDYVRNEVTLPFRDSTGKQIGEVTERVWRVGQDGREFGHSVSTAVNQDREIIIVGGPGSRWTRTFEDLEPSGVNIGLFVFTDEFTPEFIEPGTLPPRKITYNSVLNAIKDKDLLFKYFSSPFPVKFNVKIMICDSNADNPSYVSKEFPEPKPEGFVYKNLTHRMLGSDYADQTKYNEKITLIFNDIKNIFEEAFPYDTGKINNNIPAILGFFIDDSASFGERAIKPGLDEFINYYGDYSFASGLQDFYENPASGATTKYFGSRENWIYESIDVLNHTLDTGRLDEEDQYKYFSASITEFNKDLNEFNDPPPSGGAVYVFEKESGVWNLIQTIESPTDSNIIAPDRFGHAVRISDNAEVFIVGSPYINEAVSVYQYDSREKDRMYNNVGDWVKYHRDTDKTYGYFWSLKDRYDQLLSEYTEAQAARILYHELTPDGKYDLRNNYTFWQNRGGGTAEVVDYSLGYYNATKTGTIQEYQKIFSYGYGSIPYVNSSFNGFILEDYAPTSRLGYSVAVDVDGNTIAVGAPTDSFNEYDDQDRYYFQKGDAVSINKNQIKAESTLYSYVNAGAVRVFESRQYFPHNLAIEYGKFGNLGYENREEGDDALYNHMEAIYNEAGIPFIKTPFAEVDIPEEAGLVFIITPAIDALSEEILTNIKNWLALGDRHLVLIGDDPVYESNGIFEPSNKIINDILAGLNSRMRIHPARNEYEALASGCPEKPNIVASYKPRKTRNTSIYTNSMYAKGVGDIRVHYTDASSYYTCTLSKDYPEGADYSFQSANGKCKMPLVHNGDLRAGWNDYCTDIRGNKITFEQNWAMLFGTVKPKDYGCYEDEETPVSITAGYDPVPVLAAAEYPEPVTIVYPEVPPGSSLVMVDQEETITGSRIIPSFGDPISDDIQFVWSSEYNDKATLNIGTVKTHNGGFFDPDEYNGKDAVLQASGISKVVVEESEEQVYPKCYHSAQENYQNTTSKVCLIAGLDTETEAFLYQGQDTNLNFYYNIVKEGFGGFQPPKVLRIAQLGDWTGRSSFADAKSTSILASVFNKGGHIVTENVNTSNLRFPNSYDICWIANPTALPDSTQIDQIQSWLNTGNKKIVITYEVGDNNDISTVQIVKQLCDILQVTMKPLFLPEKNRYALHLTDGTNYSQQLRINQDSFVAKGFAGTSDDLVSLDYGSIQKEFVPIENNNAEVIGFFDFGILDKVVQTSSIWQMKTGVAEVRLPVLPGSGYKLFIDVVSENPTEDQPLRIEISDCSSSAKIGTVPNGYNQKIEEYNDNDELVTIKSDTIGYGIYGLRPTNYDGLVGTYSYDLQVASDSEEISMYIRCQDLDLGQLRIDNNGYTPKTTRIVSVSGCLIEIDQKIVYDKVITPIFDWVETPGIPEQIYTFQPPLREISTDNTKYCPGDSESDCATTLGGQLIADGPVVVAQELEQFSSFEYGENRSRITVISDSSLVQGPCILEPDLDGVIRRDVVNFLQSLYLPGPSIYESRGRRFSVQNKIISPERLSPHKLFAFTGNEGHMLRFAGDTTPSQPSLTVDDFVEDSYDPYDVNIERPKSIDSYLGFAYLQPYPGEDQKPEEEIEAEKEEVLSAFNEISSDYGGAPKFSGIINGTMYADASYRGGIPQIMTDTGYDYLDFDKFPSGYPGDLFGYAIDLYKGKLIVGAPFAAFGDENIHPWSGVSIFDNKPSGTILSYNGGAGAVYVFEKANEWECTRKIRPNTINVGQDLNDQDLADSGFYLGSHNYSADDLLNESIITDQFGYSVDIDGDILAVGVPGHDFENYIEESGGAFINKAFASELNIKTRNVFDVGESGFRNELFVSGSGTEAVLNNGAVMVFENRIYDWINKLQRWEFVEKIVAQGYNSRLQREYEGFPAVAVSGSENDYFGKAVAVDRTIRTDADYSIAISSPHHKFATSGNHVTDQPLLDAGAIYVYDAMLRERQASKADPNAFIQAKIFGGGDDFLRIGFSNGDTYNEKYEVSGVIYSNNEGEIFLEASGQDPLLKGFIKHRPFIESVKGGYMFGTPIDQGLRLFADGQSPISSGNIPLYVDSEYGIVYNTLGLYEQGVLDSSSGNLVLYTDCPSGITISESGFYLYASGTGFNTDTLNLRIRGR